MAITALPQGHPCACACHTTLQIDGSEFHNQLCHYPASLLLSKFLPHPQLCFFCWKLLTPPCHAVAWWVKTKKDNSSGISLQKEDCGSVIDLHLFSANVCFPLERNWREKERMIEKKEIWKKMKRIWIYKKISQKKRKMAVKRNRKRVN